MFAVFIVVAVSPVPWPVASDSNTILQLLMLMSAVELINMVMYAHGLRSQKVDPQWHMFPEMSYGTNKMAPEASQLDSNTSVSVSASKVAILDAGNRPQPQLDEDTLLITAQKTISERDCFSEERKSKFPL